MKTSTQTDILKPLDTSPIESVLILASDLAKTLPIAELLSNSVYHDWDNVANDTFEAALQRKDVSTIDVVLMVFDQIDDKARDLITTFHLTQLHVPIVIVINTDESPFYYNLLACGAQDCLTTALLKEPFLTHTLLNAVSRNQIINQLVEETNFSEALREIVMALTSTHDLTLVLNQILDMIGVLIPHTAANIALVEGELCRVAYQRGYQHHELPTDAFFPANWHAWSVMYQDQAPFLISDTTNDSHWYARAGARWIKSYLGAPIISHHNVIGFINLDSDQANFFTEQHRHRLKSFADQVAIAVSNAHTYQALDMNNQEIAMLHRGHTLLMVGLNDYQTIEEMANHATYTITETFGHADCGLMILEPQAGVLRRVARHGPYGMSASEPIPISGNGLVPFAVQTKSIVYSPDVRQDPRYLPNEPRTLTELVIPLINNGEILGVLDLQSAQLNAFSARDIRLLEVFASRVTVMLDNVRLYETLRDYANTLEARVEQRTAQLQHTRDQIEAIFNNSNDAIILTYTDGQIRQTNPACDVIFGYPTDGLFERQILDLFVKADHARLAAAQLNLIELHVNERLELSAVRADGTTFPVDVALSLIQDDDQAWQRILYSLRDMTDVKEAAAQLAKALDREREINELKTLFIRATNHEFKTPLTAMLSQAESLVKYWDRMSEESRKEKIDNIYQLVLRQREQVESVLNLQRVSNDEVSFNPQPTNIPARCQVIIDRMIFTMQCLHPIRFDWTGYSATARIDRDLLEMVLSNLLSNAIKYSPKQTPIEVYLELNTYQMQLSIKDFGIGIPTDAQIRVFQPYYRAPNAGSIVGSGIGLSLIKAYIENYGGAIRFESHIGQGTTFVVQLPIQAEDIS